MPQIVADDGEMDVVVRMQIGVNFGTTPEHGPLRSVDIEGACTLVERHGAWGQVRLPAAIINEVRVGRELAFVQICESGVCESRQASINKVDLGYT